MAVVDVDPTVNGLFNEPDYYEQLARLRRDSAINQFSPGCWTIARYSEVSEVSRSPQRFCSARGVLMQDPIRAGGTVTGSILHMDPPEHAAWRRLVSRRFTPRVTGAFEGRIRQLARGVLDALDPSAEVDFVEAIATPLPVLVIAQLLGIEGPDVGDFRRLSDATIEAPDNPGQRMNELAELYRLLTDHVHDRRVRPRDDITSLLVGAELDGEPLSTQDAVSFCLTLLVAGNETTRHLLSGAALALADHPEQRAWLAADADRIPEAVEECVRWVTPVQAFGRTATEDTELGGAVISAGDFVALLYASANRDEAVFGPDADHFDVTRAAAGRHMAFGCGEHFCIGAALARLEAQVMLDELLARFPQYLITGVPQWVSSTVVRGMASLPVVLRP